MLLERIDIDQQGPLQRVQLGPFSPKLNAILGSAGSGKTTVLRFLREMMQGNQRHATLADPQRGRVVWAGRDGLWHCVRESDGRYSAELESRDGRPGDRRYAADHRFASWSPAIIDGIVTSSNQQSIAAAIAAAQRAGLDTAVPTVHPEQPQITRLQRRVAELDRLLADLPTNSDSQETLEARRASLTAELAQIDRHSATTPEHSDTDAQRLRLLEREADVDQDIRRLRDQEVELRRMLAEIDAELQSNAHHSFADQTRYAIAETHRRQLEDLDGQLIRWRRTLRDIRQLRSRLESGSHYNGSYLGSLFRDEYEPHTEFYRHGGPETDSSDPADSLNSLEARLEATQREIEWLSSRYDLDYRDEPQYSSGGYAGLGTHEIARRLQSLSQQLQRINVRLFAPPSADSSPLFIESRSELLSCETEILAAIDHLIRHRNDMLKRISGQHNVPYEQIVSAFGDWRQCQDHPHLYDWLLSEGCPPKLSDPHAYSTRVARLESDHADYSHELDRTVNRLENSITELRRLRAQRLRLPKVQQRVQLRRRDEVVQELDLVRDLLSQHQARGRYVREREDCLTQIAGLRRPVTRRSSLATRASYWLQRLSSGRHQNLHWQTPHHASVHHSSPDYSSTSHTLADYTGVPSTATLAVSIDGHDGHQLTSEDHYLAALAVRMAAIDELARRGHGVPLLIETPSLLDTHSRVPGAVGYPDPYADYRWDHSRVLPRWLDTVTSFADAGHQTILLTRSREISDRVQAIGGSVHHLNPTPRRVVAYRSPITRPRAPISPIQDVNRDLDMAWRETYYATDAAPTMRPFSPPVEAYSAYQGDVSARIYDPSNEPSQGINAGRRDVPASPFFLTADSLVDQAPSVDAVAGARLRGVGVSRIGQLLVADPARLADALGMNQVDERAVLRWQNEARLMCRVPQLRAFDARVLVGCGITDPKHLAAMHPGELLDKVESFFATDRGRQILRSGSSYELSRITSWIAAANRSVSREGRHGSRAPRASESASRQRESRTTTTSRYAADGFDSDGYDAAGYDRSGYDRSGYDHDGYNRNGFSRAGLNRQGYDRNGRRSGSAYSERSENQSSSRSSRKQRSRSERRRERAQQERAPRESRAARESRETQSRERTQREQTQLEHDEREQPQRDVVSLESATTSSHSSDRGWRFYLERKSPIVDAPTIGPRTAHKLEKLGLYTVDDLIQADPDDVAAQLGNRRIDGEEIRNWQRQATLVCRIPMLRGHDAQLLVAAGVYEPEQVAGYDPPALLGQIDEVVDSSDGKRILRGSAAPDLKEISEWIEYAEHHRDLRAA